MLKQDSSISLSRRRRPRAPHLQPPGVGQDQAAGGDQGGPGVLAAQGQVDRGQLAAGGVRAAEVHAGGAKVRGVSKQGTMSGGEEVQGEEEVEMSSK